MKLEHIGIAVKNIKETFSIFQEILETKEKIIEEEIPQFKIKLAFLKFGETKLEFLESLSVDSNLHKFIEKHGEGLHHLAFEVKDLKEKLKDLEKKGFNLIDQAPRAGAHHNLVAFLHPSSTNNILIELCQKK
ncbi:MAG: methylmalonyl-CoA epimerase [Armatimonadetes bacterium]|nr:methylmalonyl-CoA epimerase [Armatimonadota bacterium]